MHAAAGEDAPFADTSLDQYLVVYLFEIRHDGNILKLDDALSTIRSVQYGSSGTVNPSGAATDVLVTTLTFEVLAVGDGTAEIGNVILQGDAGAVGDTFAAGPDAVVTLPEPGSTVLGMAALASVFGVASIRRRS